MKRILFFIQLIVLLLIAIPQNIMAFGSFSDTEKEFETKFNFMATPLGSGTYHIKALAFAGSAWGNCWAKTATVYAVVDNSTIKLFDYSVTSDNRSNTDKGNRNITFNINPDSKDIGNLVFTSGGQNTVKSAKENNVNIAMANTQTIDGSYNGTYVEVDWQASYNAFNGKSFKLYVNVSYDKALWDEGVPQKTHELGQFSYNSLLKAPSLVSSYLDFNASEGNEGQMTLIAYSTSTPKTVTLLEGVNQQTVLYRPVTNEQNWEFTLPQCDTTKTYILKAVYSENGQDVTISSEPLAVKPYHKITGMHVEEAYVRDTINDGHKIITWTIDGKQGTELYPADYFIIERAYSPDFSDAQQIGQVAYSDSLKGQDVAGKYRFIDNTALAAYNTNGGTKNYYRVKRASATGFFTTTNNVYNRTDSVENNCGYLPSVTGISVKEDEFFASTHKVTIHVAMSVSKNTKEISRIWNKAAYLQLYANRRSASSIEQDSIRINGSEVQYDAINKEYYIDKEVTLNMIGVGYQYGAIVRIPEGYEYLKFADYYANDIVWEQGLHRYSDLTPISNVKATQGTEYGFVRLTWDMPDFNADSVVVYRTSTKPNFFNTVWNRIGSVPASQNYYEDHAAKLNNTYYYKLTVFATYAGSVHSESTSVFNDISGWVCPTGKISGKVTTADGVAISGQKMTLREDGTTNELESLTDENGIYVFDQIPLTDATKKYHLQASNTSGLNFIYNGDNAGVEVDLSADHSLVENVNFECTSVRRFSGRALYENSTVPVAGANFRVNGHLVKDKNGNALTTDNNGDFSFNVPAHRVSVQIVKTGHLFLNDGYVTDKNDENSISFTPLSAYDGLRLYDKTKVLLRGRIIGGDKQAELALGKGLSKNNLGDNITLQMKLEGNPTADIVYITSQPDKDTLLVNNVQIYQEKEVTHTIGQFARKSITICADDSTGEYAMEVFPTKYKVTKAFAQGYASLFPNGEVSQVIDLTDSVSTDSLVTAKAVYSITYHSDVTLDFKQLEYGNQEMAYFGSKSVTDNNIVNKSFTVPLVTVVGDTVKYLINDRPVFLNETAYWLRGSAHEDYYYNNVISPSSKHEQVAIKNGTVTVENGLQNTTKEPQKFTLNENGTFLFRFLAGNSDFTTDGDNLCRLNASVEVNGYHYKADPIVAYVTGMRDKDGQIFTAKNSNITLFDVLRDPPGSGSYSYLGKGASYSYSRNVTLAASLNMNFEFELGPSYTSIIGTLVGGEAFTGTTSSSQTYKHLDVDVPVLDYKYSSSGNYSYTLNHKITTSSEPKNQGAMSDVYYGSISNVACKTEQTICFIDDSTYLMSKASIDAGAIKVLQKATDEQGHSYYLVVAEKLLVGTTLPTTFMYTQSDILFTVIPSLLIERNSLLVGGDGITEQMVQNMANQQNKTQYYYAGSKNDKKYGVEYKVLHPNGKAPDKFVDEVAAYNSDILSWINIIANNERAKLIAIGATDNKETFSVSSGQNIEHDENIEFDFSDFRNSLKVFGFNTNTTNNLKNVLGAIQTSVGKLATAFKYDELPTAGGYDMERNDFFDQLKALFDDDQFDDDNFETVIKTPTTGFRVTVKPSVSIDYSDEPSSESKTTVSSGYVINATNDSYYNVTVARTPADSIINSKDYQTMLLAEAFASNGSAQQSQYLHDYTFFVNGGASRTPWIDADSTIFYYSGTPLSVRTMKIDNPEITITDPEVSNISESDNAVFQVRLTNNSEVTGLMKLANESEFTLSVDDESNPNGAKISMDGMPLTDGRTFVLAPGESISKTFEVARGNGYDFENLKLNLACKDDDDTSDDAYFSVHYLPSSSPVKISSPSDKWVLNTLSQKDSTGYFIPVVIEGYNWKYNNFDHIELQYKKSTEGESGWVNLCSYYANDTLYAQASGTKSKEMIQSGRITHHFYGDKDPMEMKYDLRAVTFCRLGTGYVTKASDVISGTKDTRCPAVFGNPQPVNGILTSDASIILPFSEPIAYNYLDETSNFDVRGYTNQTTFDADAGLKFSGIETQDAYTSVNRSLAGKDFTVDMLIMTEEDKKAMTFFSQSDGTENSLTFGINEKRQLTATVNGKTFRSVVLDEPLTQKMTHVGMILKSQEETAQVSFFAGNDYISNDETSDKYCSLYMGNEKLHFGVNCQSPATAPFKGRMLEARLWNCALDAELVSEYNEKALNGYVNRIIGYWPLRQATGNTATESVNGADLTLLGTSWNTVKGHSLLINNKALSLNGRVFQRTVNQDYTLQFWYRVNSTTDVKKYQYANLFSAGRDSLTESGFGKLRIGYEKGKLIVRSNGNTTTLDENGSTLDNKWHNLALSVSHSQNIVNAYVDNNLIAQIPGSDFDGITSNYVTIGSDSISTNFDLLAFWHQALPQEFLKQLYSSRLSGSEMGLYVYLPFDELKESIQGSLSYQFSVNNLASKNKDFYGQPVINNVSSVDNVSSANAPILKNQEMNKLKFSWSSDGTNLLINLDMKDSEINHRNLFLTVRDVEDVNGNPMANPYSWTIYANRNILDWKDQGENIELAQGTSTENSAQWANSTSVPTNYTITTSSPYIQITTSTQGTADAFHSNLVSYKVLDGLAPGTYNEYIWLNDEDNDMTSEYELTIIVKAAEPEWAINRKLYNETMNFTAIVHLYNDYNALTVDNDTRDIVGAFVGSECVGVENISDDKGMLRLYMNIFGNSSTKGKEISFYLWDASEGVIKLLQPEYTISFTAGNTIGTPDSPVNLSETKSTMQQIGLQEGWNWISFNQNPVGSLDANKLFFSNAIFSDGDELKNESDRVEYNGKIKKWVGNDMKFSAKSVYHLKVANAGPLSILGTSLSDADRTLHINRGWNEVPYLLSSTETIERFFTDYQLGKAQVGDVLKSLDGFSTLSSNGWVGTLHNIEPGNGYYLYHQGDACDITFVGSSSAASSSAKVASMDNDHENSMPVIAEVAEGETLTGTVKAYDGAELVGEAQPLVMPDGRQLYFINVRGSEAKRITFVMHASDADEQVAADDSEEDDDLVGVGNVQFNATGIVGTVENPYQLTTKSGLNANGDIYDLSGIKWQSKGSKTTNLPKGVYIQNNKKQYKK